MIAEIIDRYTASGYSVIVMVLLATVLCTAVNYGLYPGLLSAAVIVLYNFYIVSSLMDFSYFSVETANMGGVALVGDMPSRARQIIAPWARPSAVLDLERPGGPLSWERKNPGPEKVRGSNELLLVAPTGLEPVTLGL